MNNPIVTGEISLPKYHLLHPAPVAELQPLGHWGSAWVTHMCTIQRGARVPIAASVPEEIRSGVGKGGFGGPMGLYSSTHVPQGLNQMPNEETDL